MYIDNAFSKWATLADDQQTVSVQNTAFNFQIVEWLCPGVASLTYTHPVYHPVYINLCPTYREYIQPRFNIPPGIYRT